MELLNVVSAFANNLLLFSCHQFLFICYRITLPFLYQPRPLIIGPHPSQRQDREKALLSVKAISFSQRNNMCESICAVFIRFENVYPLTRCFFSLLMFDGERIVMNQQNKSTKARIINRFWDQMSFSAIFSLPFHWWTILYAQRHRYAIHHCFGDEKIENSNANICGWSDWIYICLASTSAASESKRVKNAMKGETKDERKM